MRKVKNLILTFLLMFVGVVSASALTKSDLDYIEAKYRSLRESSKYSVDEENFDYYYFKENVNPNSALIHSYLIDEVDWDDYLTTSNAEGGKLKYQIPKDVYEAEVSRVFNVTDNISTELQNMFNNDLSAYTEYKEIDGKYYYYYELHYGMGAIPSVQPLVKGYKDLGNNQYQVYFIVDESEYLTSKIEYEDMIIKYLSYEKVEDIPSDIILYESLEDDNEDSTDEDSSKSNWDLLYEYFNDRVFDDMFDSFEDITILKDDNTMDITYIVDGKTYEMQYTYNNGILIYSKIGSRQYDEYYNGLVYEFLADRFKYNVEKLSIYLERSEGLTVEKDGIEYTFTEMYTEKEMEQKEKEFEEYWNSLTEEEKQEQGGAIGIGNPLVFSSLKVDLTNGVKTYKEELVPYYDVVEGEEQKFNSDKPEELTFKIDVDFDLFEGVYMNGKLLDPKYYTAKEGSTIITLKKDYLTELNNGTHTIKVAFKDGEFAETTFTVEKTVKNPGTGIVFKYGLFILIGLMGCLSYLTIRKQSRFPKHN